MYVVSVRGYLQHAVHSAPFPVKCIRNLSFSRVVCEDMVVYTVDSVYIHVMYVGNHSLSRVYLTYIITFILVIICVVMSVIFWKEV